MGSEALARDAQLQAGLENPVRDPRTGVYRERVTGYASRFGGTRIPSAEDGSGGGQLDVNPEKPLPFIMTIGEPGRGAREVEIDPGLFAPGEVEKLKKETTKAGKPLDTVYELMAKITEERKAKKMNMRQTDWTKTFSKVSSIESVPQGHVAGADMDGDLLLPLGGPSGVSAASEEAEANMDPAVTIKKSDTPAGNSEVDLISQEILRLEKLKQQVLENKRLEELRKAQEAEAAAEAARVSSSTEQRVEPAVTVTFGYGDGRRVSGRYHQAAFESKDALLVLTLDQMSSGSPVTIPPAAGPSAHVIVTIASDSGVTASAKVLSLGLAFPVMERYAVLVFPVVNRLS